MFFGVNRSLDRLLKSFPKKIDFFLKKSGKSEKNVILSLVSYGFTRF